jgi:hypothetical protein
MHPALSHLLRPAATLALSLSLLAVACSTRDPIFTGVDAQLPPGDDAQLPPGDDAQLPPGTALLTVNRNGTGTGTVTSNPGGVSCGSDCSEAYIVGTSVTLTATPAAGSTFAGWSGACTGTGPCTVTMASNAVVTASFTLSTYALSVTKAGTGAGNVTSSPAGISCGTDCSETVSYGTTLTLTAPAAIGSTFAGWSGGGCTGTGTCTVSVTGATQVTATFTLTTHMLTVARNGTGSGTVTSTPAGINCGTDCSEVYGYGTTVTLVASAATGSTFAGWSGGCSGTGACTIAITTATSVTATFTLNMYTLNVGVSGSGSVTSSPAGISCGADCSEVYGHGTTVTLTASPSTGWSFTGWSGGGCSGTGACTVTMTAATSVTATFTINTYTLTVSKTGSGTVTSSPAGISCGVDCTEVYSHGTTVTLTASPAAGWEFTGWIGVCTGSIGDCTFTMTGATSVTATFDVITTCLSPICL